MSEELNKKISELPMDKKIIQKLKNNHLDNLQDLWNLTRKDLKKLDFSDGEIHQIVIQLELYGLDLENRVWKR